MEGGAKMSSFNRIDTTANRLRIAMENAGKKQIDIVRETGIDKGMMSHYLKGKYEPKQETMYLLAKNLDVSEMWLWGYDCPKERPIESSIESNPVEMAERHFEIIMDEDINDIFDDIRSLDTAQKKIVKDLVHSLAQTKKEA